MVPNITYHHYHHHHVMPSARIFLTLSSYPSLSSIASSRSSWLNPVSTQSCSMYVRAGHPAFVRPCEGVHKSTSLMSSSLLLQQCPACLVRQIKYYYVTLTIQYRYTVKDFQELLFNTNYSVQHDSFVLHS